MSIGGEMSGSPHRYQLVRLVGRYIASPLHILNGIAKSRASVYVMKVKVVLLRVSAILNRDRT